MRVNSVSQMDIFAYYPNTELGDLERLTLCLEKIPYMHLIDILNDERGKGRNEYTNETMFMIFVSQFVFQTGNFAGTRRELSRNPVLRNLVGLSDVDARMRGYPVVPEPGVFTTFITNLKNHQADIDQIFKELVIQVAEKIPSFGENIAGDGKYILSYAPNDHRHKNLDDGRCENDADYSIKQNWYYDKNGERKEKKTTYYGFRKHTLVDAATELPIASALRPASIDEKKTMIELLPVLPEVIKERGKYATFDRGYDSNDFLKAVRDSGRKPIIDNRILRKGDKLQKYRDTNIYYTESGAVFYYDERIESEAINELTGYEEYFQPMRYDGFEQSRECLRYEYDGKIYRIKIEDDLRVFNVVARDSVKFHRLYNTRTSVERYHSRLDRDLGFEDHTIRGLDKMNVMVTLADIIILAMAMVHVDREQTNYGSIFNF